MSIENPTVAILGSTGYVGKCLVPSFLEALNQGKLKEVRILTSEKNLESDHIKVYVNGGAKVLPVDFCEKSKVTLALNGVDVVVSALGTGEGMKQVKEILLDALVEANVKLYFPSEFGTSHYKVPYSHEIFDGKRKHFLEAKDRGLNTVRMFIGLIMESSFGKWFGLDCVTGEWKVVGEGADIPCAVTAEKDIGRFTLEAVLYGCKDTSKCPDQFEVFSDLKTLREYAKCFEEVSGEEIKIDSVDADTFRGKYEKSQVFEELLMLLFNEGAHDYSKSTGNTLLNHEESVWKLKKIEEYANETGGVPWKDYTD